MSRGLGAYAGVLAPSQASRVPAGFFSRLLHTADTTPLEPDLLENKLYGPGVGPVLEVDLPLTRSGPGHQRVSGA